MPENKKVIDRKYKIMAVNPCKEPEVILNEEDCFIFKAKDVFAPAALREYIRVMSESGIVAEPQIESAKLLLERVEDYQRKNGVKVPDVDDGAEAARCINGMGL